MDEFELHFEFFDLLGKPCDWTADPRKVRLSYEDGRFGRHVITTEAFDSGYTWKITESALCPAFVDAPEYWQGSWQDCVDRVAEGLLHMDEEEMDELSDTIMTALHEYPTPNPKPVSEVPEGKN